ncbi:amino acid/amide ABC transporter membrane protein 2, HAAT family [Rhizobiales bacterium GAS191]|nr:amino acid/amide ABC transporter membrane protein 2, HAAT family [Rhizobiales bacterium GAS191]
MADTVLEPFRAATALRTEGRRAALLIGIGVVGLCVLPLVATLIGEPFYIRLATRIMIIAIAAMSLDLLIGFGGMVSLGHAAFIGVGAYVTGILSYHAANQEPLFTWPFLFMGSDNAFLAWPLAILCAALAALLIGIVSLRASGVYFIMITLAFAQMLYYLFIALQKYGGEDGLQLAARSSFGPLDLDDRLTFYYLVLAVLVICGYAARRLVRSRFGMLVRGAMQNERRMLAVGFPVLRYKLAAFVIAGAMAGLAGVLLANNQTFVSPADMAWTRSGELIIMVVLGGVGTLYGPMLGAAVYVLLELVLGSYTIYWQATFGPVLILFVLFMPGGLFRALTGANPQGGGPG